MKRLFCLLILLLLVAPAAYAQAPVEQNPSVFEFDCPDHDADIQHELKILRVEGTNRVVITTILLGDPPYIVGTTTKRVRGSVNVQPIAFGRYVARVNAIADTADGLVKSPDSDESNVWERSPGKPGRLQLGGSALMAAQLGEAVVIAVP